MTKRKDEPWAAKLGTSNLDPLQVMELQDAIREKKRTVELDGKKFILRYKSGTVHYSPAEDGVFSPSGYLDIKKFLSDR